MTETQLTTRQTSNTIGLYRQAIINGNFDVWQRGTSGFASDNYTADRWTYSLSGATGSVTQQTFTVGQTDVPNNPKYYLELAITAGADYARVEQKIEDVQSFSGQSVTLSFYAKGTNPGGGALKVGYVQSFGVGGSSFVSSYDDADITLTSSWQKFTVTMNIPSISGKTVGTSSSLNIVFSQGSDTTTDAWTLDLAQVQLNAGSVALPFQPKSYEEELRACQRYCQVYTSAGAAYQRFASGYWYNTNTAYNSTVLPVTMRTVPTGTFSAASTFAATSAASNLQLTSISIETGSSSPGIVNFQCDVSGTGTAGRGSQLSANATTSASITLSAEL